MQGIHQYTKTSVAKMGLWEMGGHRQSNRKSADILSGSITGFIRKYSVVGNGLLVV